MDEIQLTTLIIALYGALLSTILAVYKFYENWKRLKVELSYGIISDEPQIRDVLTLSCSNLGKRPITLTSYGISLPNKRYLFFKNESPQEFPCTLSDGQGCTLFASSERIAKSLVREGFEDEVTLVGFFGDASGKRYYGKKFKFQPNKWIKKGRDKV